MRDFDAKPYTEDEKRVAEFFFERGTGGGDDPIGFILSSYAYLVAERNDALKQLVQARECLSNIDLSWLETFDRGPDGDYGGISLGDEHKAFWRDAIAFLEASGGRPAPLPRMTEAELMDALEAAYPPLPLTDEQGSSK